VATLRGINAYSGHDGMGIGLARASFAASLYLLIAWIPLFLCSLMFGNISFIPNIVITCFFMFHMIPNIYLQSATAVSMAQYYRGCGMQDHNDVDDMSYVGSVEHDLRQNWIDENGAFVNLDDRNQMMSVKDSGAEFDKAWYRGEMWFHTHSYPNEKPGLWDSPLPLGNREDWDMIKNSSITGSKVQDELEKLMPEVARENNGLK